MAGNGPSADPNSTKSQAQGARWRLLPAQYAGSAPELTALLGDAVAQLLPETMMWWQRWRISPMAAMFTDVAWGELAALALLYDQYLADPTPKLHAELRVAQAAFGATPRDLDSLRWQVDGPVTQHGRRLASVASLDTERKARLAGGSPTSGESPPAV